MQVNKTQIKIIYVKLIMLGRMTIYPGFDDSCYYIERLIIHAILQILGHSYLLFLILSNLIILQKDL